jgi:Flp pilus assembly pilin Flp
MKLFNLKKAFAKDESGAVTVDWVVLTAALVGIAIVVLGIVSNGINSTASRITSGLNAIDVNDE